MTQRLNNADALRLVWPQWQGAGADVVKSLYPETDLETARRSYTVGTKVLEAILPPHDGPTETIKVADLQPNEGSTRGIESRTAILASLDQATKVLASRQAPRVLTLGGECSVSVAPFTYLAQKYGDDLAVLWIDSHPDVDTPETEYDGYHAMAVSAIIGQGDQEILDKLPAAVSARKVALVGLHEWEEDAYENVARWGLTEFPPEKVRSSSADLLSWLKSTDASKVAIHIDVDTVDSKEVVLGLGMVPDGLQSKQVRRIVQDVAADFDVVGLTIAEFIPRNVIALQQMLMGLPLLGDDA